MNGLLIEGVWVAVIMYVSVAILYGDVLNDARVHGEWSVENSALRAKGETGWDVLKAVGPKALAWPLVFIYALTRFSVGVLKTAWVWLTTERDDND